MLDNGVRLRGAIDLIEKHPVRGTLRITDHKTGKPPQELPKYVGGGACLQPLAYAMAAESLLGAPAEMSRLSYCTQRGGYQEIPFEITPPPPRILHARPVDHRRRNRSRLPARRAAARRLRACATTGRSAAPTRSGAPRERTQDAAGRLAGI